MAERMRYPQIPATVWWGVRSVLNKTPRAKVDERLLGTQLGVQDTAAKQYVKELQAVGILDEECRATELAHKWRLDDTYLEAAKEILENNYPETLLHLSPAEDPDREKVLGWFHREGFGRGAALNKASTYQLLSAQTPDEAPARTARTSARKSVTKTVKPEVPPARVTKPRVDNPNASKPLGERLDQNHIPLNVNVQIHISADASTEQIETIFSAMKKYLSN